MGGPREYSVQESNKEWSIRKSRNLKFLLYLLKLFSGSWMSLLLLIFIFLSLCISVWGVSTDHFYAHWFLSWLSSLLICTSKVFFISCYYGMFYFYHFIFNSLLRISISLFTLLACSYLLSTISIIALTSITFILFLSDDSKICHTWVQFWHLLWFFRLCFFLV